jgi:hypothetical protein
LAWRDSSMALTNGWSPPEVCQIHAKSCATPPG